MDFKFYKNPKLKIHMIENHNLCLKWLKAHDVANVTISAESPPSLPSRPRLLPLSSLSSPSSLSGSSRPVPC